MKRQETGAYLVKARQSLKEACVLMAGELPEAAGRAAYQAAYHSAQAFIFEHTGKAAKTHSGVRAEFARLSRGDPRVDRSFPTFLARAYSLKEHADYAIGHDRGVSLAEAQQAIEIATRFVDSLSALFSSHED